MNVLLIQQCSVCLLWVDAGTGIDRTKMDSSTWVVWIFTCSLFFQDLQMYCRVLFWGDYKLLKTLMNCKAFYTTHRWWKHTHVFYDLLLFLDVLQTSSYVDRLFVRNMLTWLETQIKGNSQKQTTKRCMKATVQLFFLCSPGKCGLGVDAT